MTKEELQRIIDLHALWLSDPAKGAQARLASAELSGADLSNSELFSADLRGADLRGADLSNSDLREADLSGANLSRADLGEADLSGACLSDANLSGANLWGACLSDADLSGADLSRATILRAYLQRAKLDHVRGLPDIVSPGLAGRVLHQILKHPETYNQKVWHCGTRHCAGGWCVELAGAEAKAVEKNLGTKHTALLALGLPFSEEAPFGPDDDPIPWLEDLAELEAEREASK